MNLKITTTDLQGMVSKAIECVSNNKLIPMTSLISIWCSSGVLTLITTDYTNYFYTKSANKVDCEDFEVSVLADTFVKLVQKTTSETITLSVEDNVLTVKGNGTYKLELPLDENGRPIKFPKKVLEDYSDDDLVGTVKISDIKSILAVNKNALATDMQQPVLTSYYCGDKVVTSNKKIICWNPLKLFNEPLLISGKVMELLGILTGTSISVYRVDDSYVFKTDVDSLYAPVVDDVNGFPINSMQSLVESQFDFSVKLSRKPILDVLDRLTLFVGAYDKKSITMTFTQEGMLLSSKKSSGSELIQGTYDFVKGNQSFSCSINIEFFQTQLNSIDSEFIDLQYGSPLAIKIVSGDIIKVVALMNEENSNGEKSSSK